MQLSSILGVSVVIFLLDWFYLLYANSHGLEAAQTPTVGGMSFPIPVQWLPVIGVVLLSLVTWYEAYYRVFPRRGSIDPLGRIRLIRAIVFSIALFVLVLYVPSLLGSGWFWSHVSGTGKSVTQVRDFGNFILNSFGSLIGVDVLWAYSAAQVFASAVMVFGAFAFARAARRIRK
jgi:formate/nitrite transporter FocA (FNT family)